MIILCEENSNDCSLSESELRESLKGKIIKNLEKMNSEQLLQLYTQTEKINFEKEMI